MEIVKLKLSEIDKNSCIGKAVSEFGFMLSKEVALVDGKYIVTPFGDVYRYHEGHKRIETQKKRLHTNGYLRAIISGKDVYIHRLVAECFIPNHAGFDEINHKDGNKANNSVENLEWCTRSENNRHAFQTGLRPYAELKEIAQKPRIKRRKFAPDDIRFIRQEHDNGASDTKLAKLFNCDRGVIYQIVTRRTYKEVY